MTFSLIAVTLTMTGCAGKQSGFNNNSNGKYSVVCTIFPEYDWVKQIIGENSEQFEVTLLLDNGVDLHSYQPTAEDILKISTCDLFIYVGGESDEWVDEALKESMNKDMRVIDAMEVLGDYVKEEELVEGMEAEDEHDDEEEEEKEYDEHVWLSLKNAVILTDKISTELQAIDTEHQSVYAANSEAYTDRLKSLDEAYKKAVAEGTKTTLLFADRFPFRYLTEDYQLDYYAAFAGCSAETEASFETIVFLAGKLDELGLENVLITENSDGKIADTVISNTKSKQQNILTMDSMQSTTGKDIKAGATYLSVMEKNLEVLREAVR